MKRMMIMVVLFLYLVTFVPVAEAQSAAPDRNESDIAILVRGPVKSMGFPLLYPNAIETWSGYYRYLELEVVVSFTREDILLPEEWEAAVCSEIDGFSPDDLSFFYKDNDWSLLFYFPENNNTADTDFITPDCLFISKFITRLKYFLRNAPLHEPPLLPAIIEF